MANRLMSESSPYLLQHKNNPVDWFPWGQEALNIADSQDKPIFLSIGYSACHWCHVMAEESFSDDKIAKLLNDNFISIKVDREERPDIDSIYMDAVQAISGQGGWPLTVFLTPKGVPFFGGTYYPPEDRAGMPGFPKVIESVLDAFNNRRDQINEASERIVEHLQNSAAFKSDTTKNLDSNLLQNSYEKISTSYDSINGGFGTMPKFPQIPVLEFLLRYAENNDSDAALQMVTHTLDMMASGGIHDQLEGGFHRYSTDSKWITPHFEKMLYDNALMANVYLNAYKATGTSNYADISELTLEFIIDNLSAPDGTFYSSIDADSNNIEGDYYLWSEEEIMGHLKDDLAQTFNTYFKIGTPNNSMEDQRSTILTKDGLSYSPLKRSRTDIDKKLTSVIEILIDQRNLRLKPSIDTKTIASWNGLALRAFAEASATLNNDLFLDRAREIATLIAERVSRDGGRLAHAYSDGKAGEEGFLEDYAFIINAFISMFESDYNKRWLDTAVSLTNSMIADYWDNSVNMFYDTRILAESLIIRPRTILDNAIPCGNSSAVEALLRLSTIVGDMEYRDIAEKALLGVGEHLTNYPTALAHWLNCVDYYSSQPKEIVIIGDLMDKATLDLIQLTHSLFIPNKVVLVTDPRNLQEWDYLPLMDGKVAINGLPTAYVCENYACKLPTHDVLDFKEQLRGTGPSLNITSLVDFHNQDNIEH